jgi:hypothetical protein
MDPYRTNEKGGKISAAAKISPKQVLRLMQSPGTINLQLNCSFEMTANLEPIQIARSLVEGSLCHY